MKERAQDIFSIKISCLLIIFADQMRALERSWVFLPTPPHQQEAIAHVGVMTFTCIPVGKIFIIYVNKCRASGIE